MDPAKAHELIERQRAYIEKQGKLIAINAYYGYGKGAVPIQWLYSLEAANLAGMQQVLAGLLDLQILIFGLSLIIFMIFMPKGIVGMLSDLKERFT